MEINQPGVQQHQVRKERPAINTRDEFRSRELKLRL